MPRKQSGSGASMSRPKPASAAKPKTKPNQVVPIVPEEPIETLNENTIGELMQFLPKEAVASLALTKRQFGKSITATKNTHPAYFKEVEVSLKGNKHINNFLSFQRDGMTYIYIGGDKNLTIYQYQRTPRTVALQPIKESTLLEHIYLSPDGTRAGYIEAYRRLHIIDPLTLTEEKTKALNNETYTLGIHPNNEWVACGSYKIDIWNKTREAFISGRGLVGYPRRIETVVFSPNGQYMVSGGYIGHVVVWKMANASASATWKKIRTWEMDTTVESVVFRTDGRYLAAGTNSGEISVWDFSTPTYTQLFTANVLPSRILRMVFLHNQPILAVHGLNKTVVLVNIHKPTVPLLKIEHCLNMCLLGDDTLVVFFQDPTTYLFKTRFYTNIQKLIKQV